MKRLVKFILLFAVFSGFASAADPVDEKIFSSLDVNGDGKLSKEEFDAKPEVYKDTELADQGCFEIADVNGDEYLSFEEMAAYRIPLPCE